MNHFFYELGYKLSQFLKQIYSDFFLEDRFWAKVFIGLEFIIVLPFLFVGLAVLFFFGSVLFYAPKFFGWLWSKACLVARFVFFFLLKICNLFLRLLRRIILVLFLFFLFVSRLVIWGLKRIFGSFGTNNGRLKLAWKMTGVILLVAIIFSFGYSITGNKVVNDSIPTTYYKATYPAFYDRAEVLSQKANIVSLHKMFSVRYFLWVSFLFFFLFSVVYTPIAYREEIFAGGQEAYYKIMERKSAEGKTVSEQSGSGYTKRPFSLKDLFKIEVLGEVAGGAIEVLLKNLLGVFFKGVK